MLARTPPPPYYAVIFTAHKKDDEGYEETAQRMAELSATQPGFLGIESVRGEDGIGITVSYWRDLESIRNWKANEEHRVAQATGRARFYSKYITRVAKVEYDYEFGGESARRREGESAP